MIPEKEDKCERCMSTSNLIHYHQKTQYVEESANWVTLCPECKEDNDAYWDERWEEYYAGCL